jgi:MFS transporter, OFA family, oxalate/formate antiporter
MMDSKTRTKAKFPWGWLMVVAATIMTFGFYGASGSFGIFLKPMEDALGLTRASASSAMSTMAGFVGLTGIIAGRLTDKYGPRIVITAGATLGFLGYLLMYWVTSLWQVHIFIGILAGISMGTCFTPLVATVSKWFTEKRVLAVGIVNTGISLGQMFIPIAVAYFIAGNGWQPAYILLAALVLVSSIPAIIILRNKPSRDVPAGLNEPNQKILPEVNGETTRISRVWSASEVIRTGPFWILVIISFVNAIGFYIILVHIVTYAIDAGIAAVDAALILTSMNIGTIVTQFLVWYIARKLRSKFTLVIVLGLQALTFFLFMGITDFYGLIISGLVFGLGFGGSVTIRLSMISEIFGTRSAGAIIGLVSVGWAVGGIIGPMLAGYIFDASQSYSVAFLIGGLLLVMGAISGLFLKAPETAGYHHKAGQ